MPPSRAGGRRRWVRSPRPGRVRATGSLKRRQREAAQAVASAADRRSSPRSKTVVASLLLEDARFLVLRPNPSRPPPNSRAGAAGDGRTAAGRTGVGFAVSGDGAASSPPGDGRAAAHRGRTRRRRGPRPAGSGGGPNDLGRSSRTWERCRPGGEFAGRCRGEIRAGLGMPSSVLWRAERRRDGLAVGAEVGGMNGVGASSSAAVFLDRPSKTSRSEPLFCSAMDDFSSSDALDGRIAGEQRVACNPPPASDRRQALARAQNL